MPTTKPLLTQQEEIDMLRDALDHIARTAASSRTSTRRLSFIEERARWALKYKPYESGNFELPGVRSPQAIEQDKMFVKRYRKLRHRDLLVGCDFAIEDLTDKFGVDMDELVDQLPPIPQDRRMPDAAHVYNVKPGDETEKEPTAGVYWAAGDAVHGPFISYSDAKLNMRAATAPLPT